LYLDFANSLVQVRAVAFATENAVLSASRDGTVRYWKQTAPQPPTYDESIAVHGTTFVNSLAFITPKPDFPLGLIVSGGKEAIIDVRQPDQPPESAAERLLLGHQGNICALDVSVDTQDPYIISGSWDASARIWDFEKGESKASLEGHDGSVWAVLAFDKSTVITG